MGVFEVVLVGRSARLFLVNTLLQRVELWKYDMFLYQFLCAT